MERGEEAGRQGGGPTTATKVSPNAEVATGYTAAVIDTAVGIGKKNGRVNS